MKDLILTHKKKIIAGIISSLVALAMAFFGLSKDDVVPSDKQVQTAEKVVEKVLPKPATSVVLPPEKK